MKVMLKPHALESKRPSLKRCRKQINSQKHESEHYNLQYVSFNKKKPFTLKLYNNNSQQKATNCPLP